MSGFDAGRPIAALFGDLATTVGDLIRIELRLFKAEIAENVSRFTRSIVLLAVGAVCLLLAAALLIVTALLFLIYLGLPPVLAALALFAFFAIIGGVLLWLGLSHASPAGLVPQKALAQFGKDTDALKKGLR